MLCAPPRNCRSIRVVDACCKWICLDDIHPHGGTNFDLTKNGVVVTNGGGNRDGNGGGHRGAVDFKLRLVASAVTAVFSIALLFFLIYRCAGQLVRATDFGNRSVADRLCRLPFAKRY